MARTRRTKFLIHLRCQNGTTTLENNLVAVYLVKSKMRPCAPSAMPKNTYKDCMWQLQRENFPKMRPCAPTAMPKNTYKDGMWQLQRENFPKMRPRAPPCLRIPTRTTCNRSKEKTQCHQWRVIKARSSHITTYHTAIKGKNYCHIHNGLILFTRLRERSCTRRLIYTQFRNEQLIHQSE